MLDLRPLRSAPFRRLAAALWVNEAGNSIGEVALALLVYDRTGSPLASASLFLALRFLPAALAPLLTTYAEAMRPRLVLSLIYTLEAGLFAAIAAATQHFSLPLVLTLVAVDGVVAIVAATLTRSATAGHLISGGLLREGNSLLNLGTMVAFAGSPILAGVLVAWRGASVALLVDAASFIVTAVVIWTAKGLHIESDRDAGTSGRLKAGADVLRSHSAVRRLLVGIALTVALSSVAVPIEVVFARTTLHAGSSGYGLLLTAWGVGMIAGAAIFALGSSIPLMRMLGISTALVAFGYAGLAASPTLAFACAFSCLGGIGNGAAWVAAMTTLQERIPLKAQSAVMSLVYGLNQVVPAAGYVVGGTVTALGSPRIAYAISAVGTAFALGVFLVRPIDRVPLDSSNHLPINEGEPSSLPGSDDHSSQEIVQLSRNPNSPPLAIG